MKTIPVTISGKYQVVIPKAARKKMGLTDKGGFLVVKKVTENEITFAKPRKLEDYFGIMEGAWGPDPVATIRKQRDEEWG